MKRIRLKISTFLFSLSIYFNCATGDPDPSPFVSNSFSKDFYSAYPLIKKEHKIIPLTNKTSFQFSQNMPINKPQNRIRGIAFQNGANWSLVESFSDLPDTKRGDRSISSNHRTKKVGYTTGTKSNVDIVDSKSQSKGRRFPGKRRHGRIAKSHRHHGFRGFTKRNRKRGRNFDDEEEKGEDNKEATTDDKSESENCGIDEDGNTIDKPENGECSTGENKDDDKDDNTPIEIEHPKLHISHKSAKDLCEALESGSSEKRSYLWAPIEQYAPALGRGFPLMPPLFNPECLKWELKRCHGTARFPMMTPCTYWAPMPIRTPECFQKPKTLEVYVRGRPKEYKQGNCPCIWPCNSFFDPIQRCRTDEKIDLETWYDKIDIYGNTNKSLQISHYKALQLCHGMKPFMHKETPVQIKSIPIRIQSVSGAPPDEKNHCMAWRYKSCNEESTDSDESVENDEMGSDSEENLGWSLDENTMYYAPKPPPPPPTSSSKPEETRGMDVGVGIGIGIGIMRHMMYLNDIVEPEITTEASEEYTTEAAKIENSAEDISPVQSEGFTFDPKRYEEEITTPAQCILGYTVNPMTNTKIPRYGECEVTDNPYSSEATESPIVESETTENSDDAGGQYEHKESSESPDVGEATESSGVDGEVTESPDEATESPAVDEATETPAVDEATESPVDEATETPAVDEATESPVDEATETPVDEATESPPVDEATESSAVDEATESAEDGSENSEGTESPDDKGRTLYLKSDYISLEPSTAAPKVRSLFRTRKPIWLETPQDMEQSPKNDNAGRIFRQSASVWDISPGVNEYSKEQSSDKINRNSLWTNKKRQRRRRKRQAEGSGETIFLDQELDEDYVRGRPDPNDFNKEKEEDETEPQCGVWVKVHDDNCHAETPAKPHEADEISIRETKSVPFGAAPRSEDQSIVEKLLECAGGFPCFLGEKKRTKREFKFEYLDSNSTEFYIRDERSLHQLQKTSNQNKDKGRTSANSKYNLKGRSMLETEGLMKLSQMAKIEKGPECKCDWPCLPFFDPINKCYNENGDLLVDENNKPIMLPRQLNKDQRHLVQCLSYLEEDDIDCNIKP